VLSYQIESALSAGELTLILEAFEPAPLPVSFVYASEGRLPLKLRALLGIPRTAFAYASTDDRGD
jgi:hypothetical protein